MVRLQRGEVAVLELGNQEQWELILEVALEISPKVHEGEVARKPELEDDLAQGGVREVRSAHGSCRATAHFGLPDLIRIP